MPQALVQKPVCFAQDVVQYRIKPIVEAGVHVLRLFLLQCLFINHDCTKTGLYHNVSFKTRHYSVLEDLRQSCDVKLNQLILFLHFLDGAMGQS